MRNSFLILSKTIFFLALSQISFAQDKGCSEWKLKEENGNFKTYVRECDDSPIKEFKVIDRFKANFETLVTTMNNVNTTKAISETCKDARIVKVIDKNTEIHYFYFDLPMGLADRDMISKFTFYSTDKTYFCSSEVYQESLVPSPKGVVRLNKAKATFAFEKMDDGTVRMEYIARADPNGWFPAWLVNMLARKEARKMIDKLKVLVQN